MATINHWGKWIDSEIQVTGVISNNSIEFLGDEIADGIDLEYEEHLQSEEHSANPDDCWCQDIWEGNGEILIGDWIKNSDGKYDFNPAGEYAAIVREDVTQVIFSKFTKRCNICSPCYPGQVDLDSDGQYLGFTLPSDMIGNN